MSETKEETTRIISSAIWRMEEPFVCLLVTKDQLDEIINLVNKDVRQKNSSLKIARRNRGINDSTMPSRRFTLFNDPLLSTLSPHAASITNNEGKEINKKAMLEYLYKCAAYWISTPSLHPQTKPMESSGSVPTSSSNPIKVDEKSS